MENFFLLHEKWFHFFFSSSISLKGLVGLKYTSLRLGSSERFEKESNSFSEYIVVYYLLFIFHISKLMYIDKISL